MREISSCEVPKTDIVCVCKLSNGGAVVQSVARTRAVQGWKKGFQSQIEEERAQRAALFDAGTKRDDRGYTLLKEYLLVTAIVDFATESNEGTQDLKSFHHLPQQGVWDRSECITQIQPGYSQSLATSFRVREETFHQEGRFCTAVGWEEALLRGRDLLLSDGIRC